MSMLIGSSHFRRLQDVLPETETRFNFHKGGARADTLTSERFFQDAMAFASAAVPCWCLEEVVLHIGDNDLDSLCRRIEFQDLEPVAKHVVQKSKKRWTLYERRAVQRSASSSSTSGRDHVRAPPSKSHDSWLIPCFLAVCQAPMSSVSGG